MSLNVPRTQGLGQTISASHEHPYLYIALYSIEERYGGPRDYHWALLTAADDRPNTNGRIHHAHWLGPPEKGRTTWWTYEAKEISMKASPAARVRIKLCEVVDVERFEAILPGVFVDVDRSSGYTWNCYDWTRDAWSTLLQDGAIPARQLPGWQTVEEKAMTYIREKEEQGIFQRPHLSDWVPTWSLQQDKELVCLDSETSS